MTSIPLLSVHLLLPVPLVPPLIHFDLVVISREMVERPGAVSVSSHNSSSIMQTVLVCYLHTLRTADSKMVGFELGWGAWTGM